MVPDEVATTLWSLWMLRASHCWTTSFVMAAGHSEDRQWTINNTHVFFMLNDHCLVA